MPEPSLTDLRAPARQWFETLRDRICAAFEALEDAFAGRRGLASGVGQAGDFRPRC